MSDVSEIYEELDIFKRPQCLLETDKDGFLTIVKKTAEEMKQITSPVNVVAIAGLYRTGKSYLMNRLAGETAGFALGSSIQSETKGIWAWCRAHPTQKDQVLLLLDTEGLGDPEKAEMERIFKEFEAENDKMVYEKCMTKITDIYKEVKDNIESRTYMVSGGFEKYKKDLQRVVEEYEIELEKENIDRMQINKAKRDFLVERQSESEAIMTEDKSISEKELKDELEKQEKKLEADFKEAQEKAQKHSQEELDRQRKQNDEQLAIYRKEQELKEKADTAAFFAEKLSRRDNEYLDAAIKLARYEGKIEGQHEASKRIQVATQAQKKTQESSAIQLKLELIEGERGCSVS